jgi:hypothetical protein
MSDIPACICCVSHPRAGDTEILVGMACIRYLDGSVRAFNWTRCLYVVGSPRVGEGGESYA